MAGSVAYLTVAEFRDLTTMPAEGIDEIEERYPGSGTPPGPSWVEKQLLYGSAYLDSRLSKRYVTPFASPYPAVVLGWLADWVTPRCYFKRGVNPSDLVFEEAVKAAERVEAQLKEAADAKDGLFDLPLRSDLDGSGISSPTPLGYSEISPYTGRRLQAEVVGQGRR